jgi:serine O-acetyltransferase
MGKINMKELINYLNKDLLSKSKRKILLFAYIILNKRNLNSVLSTKAYLIFSNKEGLIYKIITLLIKNYFIENYGIESSRNVKIGKNFRYGYANGIILGEGVVIEDNVTIYQQVTIGLSNLKQKGNLKDYPHIKNNVAIYAGVKIIGNIVINEGSITGANAVINRTTEKNGIFARIPAKKIR